MFSIPSLETIKQYAVDILAITLGGALAVVFIMYMIARSDLRSAQEEYAKEKAKTSELSRQNAENIKSLVELKANHASEIDALRHKAHSDIKRTKKITKIKIRIEDAKKTDDGPIAPVLFDTLYRLQQQTDSNRS